eukprot:3551957-Heterocapsa_arctica.AAC.1
MLPQMQTDRTCGDGHNAGSDQRYHSGLYWKSENPPEWMDMTVEQRIGTIGTFLAQNRQERSNLRRTGAI